MNESITFRRGLKIFIKNKLTLWGIIMISMVASIAIFASWIAPYDPNEIHVADRYSSPNSTYLLGTDNLGRDVLSRAIHGTRISLAIGLLSVFIGLVGGVIVGTTAAYKGGVSDAIAIEAANMLISIPTILLGIMILSIWGPGFFKLVITLAFAYFPRFIRLSRGLTLSLKEKEFVEASRASGRSAIGIIARHILPNTMSENIIAGTLWISAAILAQAGLSFLGLGIPPPTPTWGSMIRDGVRSLMYAPWVSVYPGVLIMITVIGFNMVGDGIRDFLDPRMRG